MRKTFVCGVVLLLVAGAALAVPPKSVSVVVKQGDALGDVTVSTLNTPFVDGQGRVSFVGSVSDSRRFVWWNTGPVFFSPPGVTGGEGTMGASDTGGFNYSPAVDGNDAVYTHAGVLMQKGDPVVALPGLFSVFNSRPMMSPSGTAYWMGGTGPATSTTNRHLFKATDVTNPATIVPILSGGDVIDGKTLKTSSSNFSYWISDNELHHIHLVQTEGATSSDDHVYLDGRFIAQEGTLTSGLPDEKWWTFANPTVNNAGNFAWSGNARIGAATTDLPYVAYNGSIIVRDGDVLDGIVLPRTSGAVRAAAVNDLDEIAFIWGAGSGATAVEYLFLGDATNISGARLLLAMNDEIDVDGDGISDYKVTDFNASPSIGPGLDLGEDGIVYVEVDMIPIGGGTEINAILAIPEPASLVLLGLGLLLRRR